MFQIRPFKPTDEAYARIVEIHNVLWPDKLETVENYRYDDENRASDHFFQRLVIVIDDPSGPTEEQGQIIGEAWCEQQEYESNPGRYSVGVSVDLQYAHLEYGDQAICPTAMAALWDLIADRNPKPTHLITYCREDKHDRLAFLKTQGFTEEMRYQDSELDVTAFDPTSFSDKVQQVKSLGIEILSIPELKARFDDWLERIYEMDMEILPDEPGTGEFTPEPIEKYAKMFDHPAFLPEGWLVAVDGETCVGSTSVWTNKVNPQKLETNFTGVRRSHRRKGVTTALKVALINALQQRGVTHLITGNEENNPMYQINVQLGFKPIPGILELHKKVEAKERS